MQDWYLTQANFTELYILAALEPERYAVQILHENDPCCFHGDPVAEIVIAIADVFNGNEFNTGDQEDLPAGDGQGVARMAFS